MKAFDFGDLTPREDTFTLYGKEYVLREASADAACKYRNAIIRGAKFSDGKISGADGLADAEPLLVSLCLFEKTDKGDRAVPINVVRGWPNRVQKPLFDRIKEISELVEEDDEKDLYKRRDDIQKRIDELEKAKRENTTQEDQLKNGQEAMTVG